MAYLANLTLSWTVTGIGPNGDNAGGAPRSVVISNADSVFASFEHTLVTPYVILNVPVTPGGTSARMLILLPPSTSTNAKTWNANGNTGGPLDPAQATMISLPANTSYVQIGSAGTEVVTAVWL